VIEHSDRRLVRMHIQTDPTDTVRHQALLSQIVGPAPRP
jgi:hypothetical protein